jgi:hypothetical protein
MFGMFDSMSPKGMVFNAAFEVGAAYALGDHLAYLGAVQPGMIVPLVIGKLCGAALSFLICLFVADFFVNEGREALPAARVGSMADTVSEELNAGPDRPIFRDPGLEPQTREGADGVTV